MKQMTIREIVTAIEASMMFGNQDEKIKHVVSRCENIKDHTLFFHFGKRDINKEMLSEMNNYVIVTDDKSVAETMNGKGTLLIVNDSKQAYWDFINYYRDQFKIPIIGVTGTCGKTTTKEMMKHIFRKKYHTHSTYLSQNGLQFNLNYLLGLEEKTDVAIFEMGVAYPGNIKVSGKYFKPTIGVITNIGEAHLDGCKTLDAYIKAKGEMLEALDNKGMLIINADDEYSKKIPMDCYEGTVRLFGINNSSDYQASNIKYEESGMRYTLVHSKNMYEVYIPSHGEHNVYNSLAAIATTHMVGIPIQEAINRLRTFNEMDRHVKVHKGYRNHTIIDDTWSCNKTSVMSAIKVLKKIANEKKEIMVLGKMQRLGNKTKEQHLKLGNMIMEMGGVDHLITVGPDAALTGKKVIELGMDASKVSFVDDAEKLDSVLESICDKEPIILFKMSLGKMKGAYREVVKKYCRKS
ncbi:UDP-N-acetylmuramoyl-tripeptide--D-alanyl-D-alanine ligase [Bacillus sp. FJAT-49731]|nr:UDP-N-acetylmuramoyl-tripeptide--D-alanyl-D-alanine ligase [Lederbergia citrea]MBS4203255.1 UDP-N-acetylmuramoyl-tripeptide--D-alanyl-D-alanine ligase [Lederbergia citrea]